MVAAAIMKNRKIAISQQRFDRSPRNLAAISNTCEYFPLRKGHVIRCMRSVCTRILSGILCDILEFRLHKEMFNGLNSVDTAVVAYTLMLKCTHVV